ncbi:MAG TPA: hypothetical protein PK796_05540 [Bacteroidales bacterium]|jgi:hypothetical protein|nr:hypothetical protein [Bacteroidales bacterium]
MDRITVLLERITTSWNHFFLYHKFCQDQINFNEEVRTNYFGDILSYFTDTLTFLFNPEFEKDFNKSVFQAIGILQIIYSQQDLIDELLYIFKLQQSTKLDKEPNRKIRNELIGHPIRRQPRGPHELISSVFYGKEFMNGTIHYVLYSKDNKYSGEEYQFQLIEIIDNHKIFVEKYLTKIWRKIQKILKQFQSEILKLDKLVKGGIEFENLVRLTEQRFDRIQIENYLFKPTILINCHERRDEHVRYKNVTQLFLSTLIQFLLETKDNIDSLLINKHIIEKVLESEMEISFDPIIGQEETIILGNNLLNYQFSKLFSKHPIYGVSYFKKKFQNDEEIMEELNNMESNFSSELEYYSSYEYLRILLLRRNLIT